MEEARRHCLKENARTPVSFGRVWRQTDGRVLMEEARQLCGKKKHGISGGLGKDVTAMRRPEECLWKKPVGIV